MKEKEGSKFDLTYVASIALCRILLNGIFFMCWWNLVGEVCSVSPEIQCLLYWECACLFWLLCPKQNTIKMIGQRILLRNSILCQRISESKHFLSDTLFSEEPGFLQVLCSPAGCHYIIKHTSQEVVLSMAVLQFKIKMLFFLSKDPVPFVVILSCKGSNIVLIIHYYL